MSTLSLALSLLLGPDGVEHLVDLEPAQAQQLDDEGFVVLPRRSYGFPDAYDRIYHADQPVFVTADSLLHAQHRSFDSVLAQLERDRLIEALDLALTSVHGEVPPGDLDLYLAVARSLLAGELVPTAHGDDARLEALYGAAQAERPTSLSLFGPPTQVDLSLLKPRGHYVNDEALGRYFRAMSWLGAVPIRVCAEDSSGTLRVNRAALEAALTLSKLARRGRAARSLEAIEGPLLRIFGPQDKATAADLIAFGAAARGWRILDDEALLEAVQGQLGQPRTRGGLFMDHELDQGLPVDFHLIGPRWSWDAELLTAVTHPNVPLRVLPSGLDVMAGLGSEAARGLLAEELGTYGYGEVLDSFVADPPEPDSLYHAWLATLAALDDRPRGQLPPAAQSEGWSLRLLEAQLASWAELRRDSLLYVQHNFAEGISCEYPHGYVEPAPAFFAALLRYDALLIELSEDLQSPGVEPWARRVEQLHGELAAIVDLQLAGQPPSPTQRDFLRQLIEKEMVGCGDVVLDGWYPELFFNRADAKEMPPTVADVHTAPTDAQGDPVGLVLHEATDWPRTMLVVIDGVAYYGPVSTWTEFTLPNYQRLDDAQWERRARVTPRPAWTQRYAP
ncbi:MAG: DUF3160 domain-containing protein [Alphaproteobacteria bacterium]|nr:DUF3160 domain-containing protein [Alphaproteobacteria bacterium]MCB9796122.1 DUF3160 domain-containing protein [Alphaproteobacteria bacterium]